MSSSKNIIWLASYPKSGNTWIRALFANLFSENNEPVNINKLDSTLLFSSRALFESLTYAPSTLLTSEEIDNIRPIAIRKLSNQSSSDIYIKIHDALSLNNNGESIIPADVTKAIIYIIRDPRDVAVSYAYHSGLSFERIIDIMNNDLYALNEDNSKKQIQLRQKLFSWSKHVESWTNSDITNVILVKYEELLMDSDLVFENIINKLNININPEKIRTSVTNSSFKTLSDQEIKYGFKERVGDKENFFRKGRSGTWKDVLNREQVEKIERTHKIIMQKYGYL